MWLIHRPVLNGHCTRRQQNNRSYQSGVPLWFFHLSTEVVQVHLMNLQIRSERTHRHTVTEVVKGSVHSSHIFILSSYSFKISTFVLITYLNYLYLALKHFACLNLFVQNPHLYPSITYCYTVVLHPHQCNICCLLMCNTSFQLLLQYFTSSVNKCWSTANNCCR